MKTLKNDSIVIEHIANYIEAVDQRDTPERTLIKAILLYMHEELPENEQTFAVMAKIVESAGMEDEKKIMHGHSMFDVLFSGLENKNPDSQAVSEYHAFKILPVDEQKWVLYNVCAKLKQLSGEEVGL